MAERLVIVGFGPVAARLIDELTPAIAAGSLQVTVVGAERDAAYNRVLVADVGVGRMDPEALVLAEPAELAALGVDVRLGSRVLRMDRARQQVLLTDGGRLGYDRLVLATGARAVLPNLPGMNPDPAANALPAGVTALRTLQDAATVRPAVAARQRVVVLGGGILGLEAALALADEGAHVTVVHHGPHVLGRSIDAVGGAVLGATLRRRGIRLVLGARSTGLARTEEGAFAALILADGRHVPGDLLVLCCGVRPRIELAEGAGLPTAAGILVDHGLQAHSDEHVFAIGDCAQVRCPDPGCGRCSTSRGPAGLIGPGWRQAEWLAARLVQLATAPNSPAPAPLPAETDGVILLKARGVDVATAGDAAAEPWDFADDVPDDATDQGSECSDGTPHRPARALGLPSAPVEAPVEARVEAPLRVALWADPEHGRYVKMSTRAGVLAGLVCVGMPRTAAELVLLFERGSELPADRSGLLRLDGPEQLLQGIGAPGPSTDPEATVCRCAGISRGRISAAVEQGCSSVADISRQTRAGTGCGGCHPQLKDIIEQHFAAVPA
jgi:assimilatory nitrate reductase electron transfer subunit